ncbi:MAG: ubiquinone/menaquinone biosynthesis methyltransferase [Magnetococcales bacterium]|nr:ubiquinone/menaquinone biosynthesis methyltransferase [Magnetococcales bacterium]
MPRDQQFGKHPVTSDERRQMIRTVFKSVATRYNLMNDLMSFGIHRFWKSSFVKQAAHYSGKNNIDLAGGTGDIAALISRKASVWVVDPSIEMMTQGRAKKADITGWIAAEGEQLPLADGSINLVTIAFGIRNLTSLQGGLIEIHRVIKPGGWVFCLEFSQPHWWLRPFYNAYSEHVIPRLGALVAQDSSAYRYLVDSIRSFPDQTHLERLFAETGFRDVGHRNLSFGIAAIHWGRK